MAGSGSLLQRFDAQLDQLFAGWSLSSTLICVVLVAILVYPVVFGKEPDFHPLLLARQSAPSAVRQNGESSAFRSLDSPHGYPLRSGLNVKDPEAPKWTSGRDGDLRDIWKQAIAGPNDGDGKPTGQQGKIFTVLGKEEVLEHDLGDLTKEIIAVGEFLKEHQRSRLALCLPNSVEMLVVFFGISPSAYLQSNNP